MTVEVFAYGSLATEFGNGYHFIAESEALKRDEKSRAALGTLCNTIGQTGDPGRTVCYAASIRGERGWWVWLRGVPQPDWQGRQGIFLAGVAVRWSEAQARGEQGAPWTIPWSALPFPNFADIKRTLEQAPSGKFRQGYFMRPHTIELPPWPGAATAQLIDERLPALLVGARKLAEGGNYHLLPDPAAEDLVAWLALLQPPATRPGFSYVINAPPRLSWQPRLIFYGAAEEVPAGERSPLWGKSPVMPPAGASLATMLQGRRARGELGAIAFRTTADVMNVDTYWRTLVDQDRWTQLARHPERIDTTSASEAAGLVRYAASGDGAVLRQIARRLAGQPERLAEVIRELAGDGAQQGAALLLLTDPQIHAALAQIPSGGLSTETAEPVIDVCFAAGGKTALLPWQSPGLRQCLRDADVARLPLARMGPAANDLFEHRGGTKSLSWMLAIWRAAGAQGRRDWWLTATQWVTPRLHHYSGEDRVEVLRGISARSKEIPAHELDGLRNHAAIAIGEVKEPNDRTAARAAWPVLAQENAPDLTRREREWAPATQPSSAWIKWALASTLLITILSAATWWWSHQPIPNLAEREARDISSVGEKGRTR